MATTTRTRAGEARGKASEGGGLAKTVGPAARVLVGGALFAAALAGLVAAAGLLSDEASTVPARKTATATAEAGAAR